MFIDQSCQIQQLVPVKLSHVKFIKQMSIDPILVIIVTLYLGRCLHYSYDTMMLYTKTIKH